MLVRRSSLFVPVLRESPREAAFRSHALLLRCGMVKQSSQGVYSMLPWGLSVLRRVERVVERHMEEVGSMQVSLPSLLPASLLRESGRWDAIGAELVRLQDRRQSDMCLAPTHEESIVDLLRDSEGLSYRSLPLSFFQIGRKHRDEARPRGALLRASEFVMKDAYSFHVDEADALRYYERMKRAYCSIMETLRLPYLVAEGGGGNIGGTLTHEFHVPAAVGEDVVHECGACGRTFNSELAGEKEQGCEACGSTDALAAHSAIEVGHIFYLGDRYSACMKLRVTGPEGRPLTPMMGCYGIGVSRIVQSVLEVLGDEHGAVWPSAIAPYEACLIVARSKLEQTASDAVEQVGRVMGQRRVVLDDRSNERFGSKMYEATLLGYPFIFVLGKDFERDSSTVEVTVRRTMQKHKVPIERLTQFCQQMNAAPV